MPQSGVCWHVNFSHYLYISIDDKLAATLLWGWYKMGWNLLWFFAITHFLVYQSWFLQCFALGQYMLSTLKPQLTKKRSCQSLEANQTKPIFWKPFKKLMEAINTLGFNSITICCIIFEYIHHHIDVGQEL